MQILCKNKTFLFFKNKHKIIKQKILKWFPEMGEWWQVRKTRDKLLSLYTFIVLTFESY